MPEPRERPRIEKPKARNPSALSPKQAAQMLTSNYKRQLERRVPGEENETEYATDRAENMAKRTTEKLAEGIHHFPDRKQRINTQWQSYTKQGEPATDDGQAEPPEPAGLQGIPKERTATGAGRQSATEQAPGQAIQNSQYRTLMARRPSAENAPRQTSAFSPAVSPRQVGLLKDRPRTTASTIKTRENVKTAAKSSGKAGVSGMRPRRSMSITQALRRTRQSAQRQMTRRMVTQARKTAKKSLIIIKKAAVAITKVVAGMIGSIVGFAGGGVLLVVLVVVFVVAAIGNSPFGIFFAGERSAPNTVSISEAASTVNIAFNAKLEELQSGDYNSIVINGQAADWPDVLSVFAAKTAGTEDGVDVVTLDANRVERLTNVFWDMTIVTSEIEAIKHPGNSEDDSGWTEHILHITITAKTANDMRTQYSFTQYQNNALDELLVERDELAGLIGSLIITNGDVSAILDALPEDLPAERRETVKTALTLVGKVNYFWGGKSSAIGWDSRWGTLQQVTAADSPTTGTYRPYGLDCSGYIDWVFNNSLGYVIGHGGGVIMQHTHCTDISWDEAQPGDLAFYPDDSHGGIVLGRSDSGGILVANCSSGRNNVVITDFAAGGFTAIGRPDIFN